MLLLTERSFYKLSVINALVSLIVQVPIFKPKTCKIRY